MDTQQMDRLISNIQQEFKRLTILQDEIGLKSHDKSELNAKFFESIADFVNQKVNQVENDKQHIIQEAKISQTSILSYKRLMGEYISDQVVLDPSKSLQANLTDLQNELSAVKEQYDKRLSTVKELYLQLEEFKQALGDFVNTSMLMANNIDVSTLAVHALEDEISKCEVEYIRRKEIVDRGVEQVSNLFVILGIQPESDRDRIIQQFHIENDPDQKMNLCNMLVSQEFMKYISRRIQELQEQKQQIECRKEEIATSLKHLWNRLHVKQQERDVFLMANRGLTSKDLDKFENELAKLNQLKQERIGDFIQTAKEELASLWDRLYFNEKQRAQFQPDQCGDHVTDVVLEAYENEISRLELELEDSKYILELIEKHMNLKKEIEEFEATTSDPNRLFGKGNRDPGRLLREERFRKRISRELPKVTKELEGALLEYEALKSHPFLVYGKPYFDVIYGDTDQQSESTAVERPKTPHRERNQQYALSRTPRRIEPPSTLRKPMTSPRPNKTKRTMFNTPQLHRTKSFNLVTATADTRIDTSASILHSVRARNTGYREQKPIKRGHIFDDEDDDDSEDEDQMQNENIAPNAKKSHHSIKKRKQQSARITESQSENDEHIGLDLGIFDDGPDLSDMSEVDA